MDLALRLVVGLDDLGQGLLAEELGTGEGDLDPVGGAGAKRLAQRQSTGSRTRAHEEFPPVSRNWA